MTLTQIMEHNAREHLHWFAPAAMRFFRSRVSDRIYPCEGGAYLVSSERPPHGPRRYTVRRYDSETGNVTTVGAFLAHASSRAAHARAKYLAHGEEA